MHILTSKINSVCYFDLKSIFDWSNQIIQRSKYISFVYLPVTSSRPGIIEARSRFCRSSELPNRSAVQTNYSLVRLYTIVLVAFRYAFVAENSSLSGTAAKYFPFTFNMRLRFYKTIWIVRVRRCLRKFLILIGGLGINVTWCRTQLFVSCRPTSGDPWYTVYYFLNQKRIHRPTNTNDSASYSTRKLLMPWLLACLSVKSVPRFNFQLFVHKSAVKPVGCVHENSATVLLFIFLKVKTDIL